MSRVSICEDETILCIRLRRELRRTGWDVANAPDGNVAIAKARTLRPDFVIMDIKMPECDGHSASAATMRHTPPYILVLTAYGDHCRAAQGRCDRALRSRE